MDRCVTGLVAQQQCVGPLHTPLADVAVTALSYHDLVMLPLIRIKFVPTKVPQCCKRCLKSMEDNKCFMFALLHKVWLYAIFCSPVSMQPLGHISNI